MTAVAPLAGAWIETLLGVPLWGVPVVAPLAGAWIETVGLSASPLRSGSHPLRVRGLKQLGIVHLQKGYGVAPLAGAWIETLPTPLMP